MHLSTQVLLAVAANLRLISAQAANATGNDLSKDGTGNYTRDGDWYFNNTLGHWRSDSLLNVTQVGDEPAPPFKPNPGDNCDGSWCCSRGSPCVHRPLPHDCIVASDRFADKTYYDEQSCSNNHCVAIFGCNNIDFWPPIYLQGSIIKDEFNLILNKEKGLGCNNCGSRYFPDPYDTSEKPPVRCHVTFNFCNFWCSEGPKKCGVPGNGLTETEAGEVMGFNATLLKATQTNFTSSEGQNVPPLRGAVYDYTAPKPKNGLVAPVTNLTVLGGGSTRPGLIAATS